MKFPNHILAILFLLSSVIIFGCQPSAKKAIAWKTFRSIAERQIRDNTIRVAELKARIKVPGKTFDTLYIKRIDSLEKRNKEMEKRMDNYAKSPVDWETFNHEFTRDLEEIGEALRTFVVDNQKLANQY